MDSRWLSKPEQGALSNSKLHHKPSLDLELVAIIFSSMYLFFTIKHSPQIVKSVCRRSGQWLYTVVTTTTES